MPRDFASAQQQSLWDHEQWLDDACRRLLEIDADLVEWTLRPARDGEKLICAEVIIRDGRDPLASLARRLRAIADVIDRLRRPPSGAMRKAA